MNRWAGFGVAVATVLLAAAVTASVDWSQATLRDPARTLLLGPHAAFVYARSPTPPVFGAGEMALFLGCGIGFFVAGLVVRRARPADGAGWLIVVGSLLWLAAGLRRSSNPILFTVGIVLTNAPLLPIIPLTLGFPTGRLHRRWEYWFVGAYWTVSTVGVAAGWLFIDPRAEPAPHPSTSVNLLLVHHDPAVALPIQFTVGMVGLALDVALGIVVIVRWRSGTPAYRFAFAPLPGVGGGEPGGVPQLDGGARIERRLGDPPALPGHHAAARGGGDRFRPIPYGACRGRHGDSRDRRGAPHWRIPRRTPPRGA
ncbi:hypothetical protein [Nocardia crassostreae]|uniref:hypothetical protein n=1 Tax=Nocardia crassostreae TaxID=53428 RepID=UPI00082D4817|nr:hypothetical protein [Nocardia crassostreae]